MSMLEARVLLAEDTELSSALHDEILRALGLCGV
jgi:hypothetical protein